MSPQPPDTEEHSNPEEGNSPPVGTANQATPLPLLNVEPVELQEEMEQSFLEYAMSVIVSRALPDARDGLKPVHRRILYAMFDQNIRPDRPHIKCARVVGDVMGRFHPHGELAIYDALARMVQDFSLRHPLIDGHGNFGSTGPNEGPAAMRYTECRLSALSMRIMEGIDEDTVDFVPNYDASDQEPVVLPARFPNLLVNGSQGIAVGMATNIPPHNLAEIIEACRYYLSCPDATPDDLMRFVQGPDFPTGATILGRQGIQEAFRTGRGSIKLRAVAEIVPAKSSASGDRIVVTEFPYQTSAEVIEGKIADLVRSGDLDGISATQNDSAGRKPRLVIQLKRDANTNIVLNSLFKYTPLQTSFAVNMLALVDGVPRTLNLAQLIGAYVDHQIEVVTRRSRYRLRRAEDRAHIVSGLLRAIDLLDQVIAAIRGSDDRSSARTLLMAEPFQFSEIQANHILDMTLGRLTRLGRRELEDEQAQLMATIAELQAILGSPERLREVLDSELGEIAAQFSEPRKTHIHSDVGEITDEQLIEDEEIVVTLTRAGYIKAVPTSVFKTQARGGKGVRSARLKEEDLVSILVHTTAKQHLLFFSNKGRVFRLRAYEIPSMERTARGTAVVNIIPLEAGEVINAIIATRDFKDGKFLLFITKAGQVKKTALQEYDKSRREGFIAIGLRSDDEVVDVCRTSGSDDVVMVSRKGLVIRFAEGEVREMNRSASGVRGMRLQEGDEVVSGAIARENVRLLLVTRGGYGKRVMLARFNSQGRGGRGIRGIRLTSARGDVAVALMVEDSDELMLVSTGGTAIRTAAQEIATQGREATGVRVMNLAPEEEVAAAAIVAHAGDDPGTSARASVGEVQGQME